jgi:hypothetical protein
MGFVLEQESVSDLGCLNLLVSSASPALDGQCLAVSCPPEGSPSIGLPYLEHLRGLVAMHGASRGVLIADSPLEASAADYARTRGIHVIDAPRLEELLRDFMQPAPEVPPSLPKVVALGTRLDREGRLIKFARRGRKYPNFRVEAPAVPGSPVPYEEHVARRLDALLREVGRVADLAEATLHQLARLTDQLERGDGTGVHQM